MISVSVGIILIMSIALLILMEKNDKLIVGMMLSYAALLTWISVYIIKIGGFSTSNLQFLFIFDALIDFLKNLPIRLNLLSYCISTFRCMFVLSMIYNSISANLMAKHFFKKRKWLYFVVALPVIVIMIVSYPRTYFELFGGSILRQNIASVVIYIVIYGYIFCGFLLYIKEYMEIKVSWFKKKLIYLAVMVAILCISFCILAGFNPFLIVADSVDAIKIVSFFRIYLSSIQTTWYFVSASSVCAIIAIAVQAIMFLKIEYDRENVEVLIKNKMANANISSTVMIHGMKNQILSTVFLCNQIQDSLNNNSELKKDEIAELTTRIKEINKGLLEKMTKTYSVLKDVNIVLKPINVKELIEYVDTKIKEKYVNTTIEYRIDEGMIVADKELLAEAIYNILSNAVEATKGVEFPKVVCETMFRRTSTIIRIIDNGVGIDKKMGNKVFMPFTTSKNTNENWGLGLSYAMNIVKKHMGDIVYVTTPMVGTEFDITLPKFDDR